MERVLRSSRSEIWTENSAGVEQSGRSPRSRSLHGLLIVWHDAEGFTGILIQIKTEKFRAIERDWIMRISQRYAAPLWEAKTFEEGYVGSNPTPGVFRFLHRLLVPPLQILSLKVS